MPLTIKELRKIIKNLPDDALVLQDDPYSEFSYDMVGADCCRTKIDHITNDGKIFYDSWCNDSFNQLLDDNPDDKEQLEKEYKPSLVLYLG